MVQNSKEISVSNLPWRHDCRSCCSQQEMHGNSLKTVFNLFLWICSKTHWNKRLLLLRHEGFLERRPEKLKATCPHATSKYQTHLLISAAALPQQARRVLHTGCFFVIGLMCSKCCGIHNFFLSSLLSSPVGRFLCLTSLSSVLAQLLLNHAHCWVVTTLLGTNILQNCLLFSWAWRTSPKRDPSGLHTWLHTGCFSSVIGVLCAMISDSGSVPLGRTYHRFLVHISTVQFLIHLQVSTLDGYSMLETRTLSAPGS